MRKFFSPVGWLLFSTLFWGMGVTMTLFFTEEANAAGGFSTAEADVAATTFYSLVFMGGYLLAAAGIGYFARGATRARLTFGMGVSILFWVLLGLLVLVGPVVGYSNFAPDFGIIPMVAALGMMISGLLHWNDEE
ncbi:hypothetical protein C3B54_11855 [Pontimonas salivibrio]|uniref:Uncharacterized protein n=2 Tax=Pontimonas salivibrio TaxID=1159327 RepID=A0A2L2BQ88_9MICO|nr:hypothetical protein C3B54_11855 [Pontimonas salivibrio]